MFGISLARISLLTGTSLGGGVGVSPTLDLNFRGQGYSAAMAGYTFNQLIDFTRTSAATYVDATGKIVSTPASRNLLTFTQEFDNAAWLKNNVTITTNSTAAPDGTLTAETLTASANAAVHNVTQAGGASGVQQTFSVYAKAGTSSFVQLWHGAAASIYANFNVSTGVVGTVGAGATATISSAGNGWYRCTITCTPGLTNQFRAAMVTSTTAAYAESWPAAGTETIFLWGAQLEAGSAATDYTRNVGGVYPPRFDYDPVTRAPRGLLVEEQRTNLLVRSEEFDNAAWSKINGSITANATTSPDGTVDADLFVPNTTGGVQHRIDQTPVSSAVAQVFSVFVKASGYTWISLRVGTVGRVFDIANGIVGTAGTMTGTITSFGNGWYRCAIAVPSPLANDVCRVNVENGDSVASVFAGDGTSGIFVWGAQLEAGAFPTSYIPTVASQVTRTADVATITGANFSQWYNQSEGTFVVESSVYSTGISGNRKTLLAATEGNFNNSVLVSVLSGTTASGGIRSGGVQQADTSVASAISANTVFKMAFAVKADNFALCVNGGTVSADTSGAMLSNATLLDIGYGPQNNAGLTNTAGDYLNGHIRSIKYFPTRLSNTQLQALTV